MGGQLNRVGRGGAVGRDVRRGRRAAIALAAAVGCVRQMSAYAPAAPATFDGDAAVGTAGDNVTWGNAANWTTNGVVDALPANTAPGDDLTFGGGTAGGVIDLGANRFANSLTFNRNYTLGLTSATANVLTVATANYAVAPGANGTINAVLAGGGGIALTGGGTLTLNRNGNTFTGPISVDGAGTTLAAVGNGTADQTSLGAAGARAVTLTNGGTFSLVGTAEFNPNATTKSIVIGTGGGTINAVAGRTVQLDDAGQFSGTGSLIKTGDGVLFLNNQAFTYTGAAVNVNGGTLRVGANTGVLGATNVPITVAAGATFDVQTTLSGTKPVNIGGAGFGGNGTLIAAANIGNVNGAVTLSADSTLGGAGNLIVSGVLTDGAGTFNVAKVGAGALILTNAGNDFGGNVAVTGGAIRGVFGGAGATIPGTAAITLNGGALESTVNFAGTLGAAAGQVNITGGASGFSAGAANLTASVNGGAALVWGTTPGFSPSTFIVNQATAQGTLNFQNPIDLNNATRNFAGNSGNVGTVSGVISNSGASTAGVTINGTGVLAFTGANTYTGTTTLTAGTLSVSADANLGSAGTPLVFNGGTLRITGTTLNAIGANLGTHPVTLTASRTIGIDVADAANNVTLSQALVASQSLTKVGPGTLTLGAASNTVTTLNMNGGTLDIGSGTLNLSNLGSATLRGTANSTINATGGGSLVISTGGGTNYGDNSVSNGVTLTINAKVSGSAAGAGFELCCDDPSGTIQLNNPLNDFTGNVIMNRAGTIGAASIGNQGQPGALGLGTTIQFSGINGTTLGSRLRYTGPGESTNRILVIAQSVAHLEAAGTGRITYTTDLSVTNTAAKTLNLEGAGEGELAGVIPNNTNATTVVKTGTGRWTLSGTNTYTGVTIIGGGVLNVASLSDYDAPGALGLRSLSQEVAGSAISMLFRGGTLQYTGSTPQSTNRQIRLNNNANNTIDASGSVPSATISFTRSAGNTDLYENAGARTLNFTGTNTGANTFAIPLTDQAAGTGVTSVNKAGVGTWVLTGLNTYTGVTAITAGTLMANTPAPNSATGTGMVSVGGTGTLGGTGRVGGSVTVNPGGTLAPGASIGTLSIAGPVGFGTGGAGAAPTFGVELQASGAPVAGTDSDLLALTGAGAAGVLSLTNADRLNLLPLTDVTTQTTYTIATFASETGTFDNVLINGLDVDQNTSPGLPNYVLVTYNPTNIQVTVNNLTAVPEPASLGLLALGSAGLLRRRRRPGRCA